MALTKIVSGGQTGVDRGALDAALAAGFACGGWVPKDRNAEDGPIPDRYPLMVLPVEFATGKWQRTQVREASQSRASDSPVPGEDMEVRTARPVGGKYRQRTVKNAFDSDGTAILFFESLKGGTLYTHDVCRREHRPYIVLDATRISESGAAAAIVRFIEGHEIQVLNVAGPRASKWKEGHAFALAVVGEVIRRARQQVEL